MVPGSLNNNRVTVAWSGEGASEWQVTMHTPGPLNGRTAIVKQPLAVYSGLWSGHTGYVTIQPLVDGYPLGGSGHVYFTTTHVK